MASSPAIGALGTTGFVMAWEDVEGARLTGVIRAQMVDKTGISRSETPYPLEKPNGTLEGTPVIEQLANGGFAIAFVDRNGWQ